MADVYVCDERELCASGEFFRESIVMPGTYIHRDGTLVKKDRESNGYKFYFVKALPSLEHNSTF